LDGDRRGRRGYGRNSSRKIEEEERSAAMGWFRCIVGALLGVSVLAGAGFGGDAGIVESKLRAKYGARKVTVKGKVVAAGDWPLTVHVDLIDAEDRVIASTSDSLRAPDGSSSFQIELTPTMGKRFEREDVMRARVRYWVRQGKKKEEGAGTVALVKICPNLMKRKRWWIW
jgi:hypothetical protein